jgi:LPXTG-site transpeptidase (sortase) family protein
MRKLLANFFIFTGFILIVFSTYLFYERSNPNRLAFSNVKESTVINTNLKNSKPLRLTISELNIDAPIISAKYEAGKWETTTKGVSFLISSPNPGESGNSIFYGHNYKNILGNLTEARPGQIIKITKADGSEINYKIEYVQIVNADQQGILDQTDDYRLTLYTCTGFLDSKRLVVTAFLQ